MEIKVIIAAHKQYPMPDKDCYLPVQVGRVQRRRNIPSHPPHRRGRQAIRHTRPLQACGGRDHGFLAWGEDRAEHTRRCLCHRDT